MIVLLLAVVCGAGACVLAATQLGWRRGADQALARVWSYGRVAASPVADPASDRRALPLVGALGRIALRLTPGRDRDTTLAQLQAAGMSRVSPETFLAVKAAFPLVGILICVLGTIALGAVGFLLGLIVAALGFAVPDIVIRARTTARRERILGELPNALDLLSVIVEAGLGLDGALVRYVDTAEGPLADEIGLLVAELRVGSSRADGFRRLAERVPATEMRSFVRAVVHADRMGASLTKTLSAQAADARYRRQTVAEERANKSPVKILFPMIFCIFPLLMLVVLGPPLMSMLGGM